MASQQRAGLNYALILQKLAQLDIAPWDYIDSDEGKHIRPIAEDFNKTCATKAMKNTFLP